MIEVRYNKKIHTRMGIVMKKKNVFLWTILTGIVITIILIFGPLKKDIWDTNASKLEDLTDSLSNPMVINDFSKWTPFYIVVITTILMEKRFFVNKIEIEKEIKSD